MRDIGMSENRAVHLSVLLDQISDGIQKIVAWERGSEPLPDLSLLGVKIDVAQSELHHLRTWLP